MNKTFIDLAILALSVLPILSTYGGDAEDGDLLVYASDPAQGFVFNAEQSRGRFLGDFIRWAREDIGSIPVEDDTILFIGSSSIRMWRTLAEDMAPRPILQRGFGGSTMDDVIRFQDFFARYRAKTIVVYEGDNDLKHGDPASVARVIKHCETFVETIHQQRPDTEIYFISPKPAISRWALKDLYARMREELKAFTGRDPRLHYIDVASPMLDSDGNPKTEIFIEDDLHLNKKGYAIWTQQIRAALGLEGRSQ